MRVESLSVDSASLLRTGIGIADAGNPYGCCGRNPSVVLVVLGIRVSYIYIHLFHIYGQNRNPFCGGEVFVVVPLTDS